MKEMLLESLKQRALMLAEESNYPLMEEELEGIEVAELILVINELKQIEVIETLEEQIKLKPMPC